MEKYKSARGPEIEAGQFMPPLNIPKGVFNVYESIGQNFYSGQIWRIENEKIDVKQGEWVIQEPDNPERFYTLPDALFKRKYTLLTTK